MSAGVRAAAVVPAGGAGRRMGGRLKQFLSLAGEPVLLHALRPFLADARFDPVVVALPPEEAADPPDWLSGADSRVMIVAGGEYRRDSVRLGLEALPAGVEVALIHDAARPLVSAELVERVLVAAASGRGAVAALPVSDTIKEADAHGRVVRTPPRETLWAAQTPQGFPLGMILDAHRRALAEGVYATDDAALVERYGGDVLLVDGSAENLKVTVPGDMIVAEAILAARRRPERRERRGPAPPAHPGEA